MAIVSHPFLSEGVEARGYQIGALKACLSASTLLVMPTGFGKTAVEWMAMAEFLRKGSGKILLVAPTTGLVDQQVRMAHEFLNFDNDLIKAYTGAKTPAQRQPIWEAARILMATPQVIRNDAQNGAIDLKEVDLLIFDEAHHATGNHAYAVVGDLYKASNEKAHVIGATASPGTTESQILEVASRLGIEHLEVHKKDSPYLSPYKVDMNIERHLLNLPQMLNELINPIQEHQAKEAQHLRDLGFLAPTNYLSSAHIEEAHKRASTAIRKRDVRGYDAARRISDLRRLHITLDLLKTQGLKAALSFIERAEEDGREGSRGTNRFIAIQAIHDFKNSAKVMEEIHPKPDYVAKLVENQTRNSDSKILIFTEYRDTVELLCHRLNSIEGVIAERFIGQSGKGKRAGMNQKQQLEQLNKFRDGQINTLVATSVGEEGLDVPAADLVILYEPVPSAVRAIQRRGRTARQREGSVHILIAKNTRDEFVQSAAEKREEKMYTLLDRLARRGRLPTKAPASGNVVYEFEIRNGEELQPAAEFWNQEKQRLTPQKTIEVSSEAVAQKPPQSRGPPVIPPAQKRPRAQMGLEQFLVPSEEETKQQEAKKPVNNPAIPIQKREVKDWGVILDSSRGQVELVQARNEKTPIQVDFRESSTTFCAHLRSLGVEFEFKHMPNGDIRISDRVLIERKSARDLVNSIIDGRLLAQIRRLKASAQRPLLLVEIGEGHSDAIHPNAVHGALAHVTLDLGVPVMMTKNALESAYFVSVAQKRELDLLEKLSEYSRRHSITSQDEEKQISKSIEAAKKEVEAIKQQLEEEGPLAKRWRNMLAKQRIQVLAAIPGLGQKRAASLIDSFSDIAGVFAASEEELAKATGIGESSAREVYRILHD